MVKKGALLPSTIYVVSRRVSPGYH